MLIAASTLTTIKGNVLLRFHGKTGYLTPPRCERCTYIVFVVDLMESTNSAAPDLRNVSQWKDLGYRIGCNDIYWQESSVSYHE